ncbi:MAG: hypothetical protein IJY07_03560 [Clostridia bacterium]|nr:hypothetical protein [Clostridia bacterium]
MKKALSIIAVLALVAVLGVALVACVPSDPEKAAENLESEGYEVFAAKKGNSLGGILSGFVIPEDCETVVAGVKDLLDGDMIFIYYFEEADDAKDFYEDMKADFDKADEEEKEGMKIGRNGKVVYTGSEEAVKAAG